MSFFALPLCYRIDTQQYCNKRVRKQDRWSFHDNNFASNIRLNTRNYCRSEFRFGSKSVALYF